MVKKYVGILAEEGKEVTVEDAFLYALERCVNGSEEDKKAFEKEFGEELVEWFFSGNWVEREESEEE